jgi:hypothetical protein
VGRAITPPQRADDLVDYGVAELPRRQADAIACQWAKTHENCNSPSHASPGWLRSCERELVSTSARRYLASRVGFATHRENKRAVSRPTARIRVSSVRLIVRACYARS